MTPRNPDIAPARGARRPHAAAQAGFSIVEVLVALVLGMALTAAITVLMTTHDATRRALTSTNDAQLNANYLSFVLDRLLRSAGSGYAQGWSSTYGCLVRASRGGVQLLPRTSAFPAPFASVQQQLRLAPLLIHGGIGAGGSDVLAVTAGASGRGEVSSSVLPGSATANSVSIATTVGMRGGDLILVAEPALGCMLQQLATPFAGGASEVLTTGGAYAPTGAIAGLQLASFSGAATVSLLGNPAGNPPQWQLIGLGGDGTLFSHDLLRLDGSDTPRAIADGVLTLRARYGVDTNADGQLDTWIAPSATGYTAADLQDGSDAARDRLRGIMAVRIGIVLRGDRAERDAVSPSALTLFGDLPADLRVSYAPSDDERRMRLRALEFTVPLRNAIHQLR